MHDAEMAKLKAKKHSDETTPAPVRELERLSSLNLLCFALDIYFLGLNDACLLNEELPEASEEMVKTTLQEPEETSVPESSDIPVVGEDKGEADTGKLKQSDQAVEVRAEEQPPKPADVEPFSDSDEFPGLLAEPGEKTRVSAGIVPESPPAFSQDNGMVERGSFQPAYELEEPVLLDDKPEMFVYGLTPRGGDTGEQARKPGAIIDELMTFYEEAKIEEEPQEVKVKGSAPKTVSSGAAVKKPAGEASAASAPRQKPEQAAAKAKPEEKREKAETGETDKRKEPVKQQIIKKPAAEGKRHQAAEKLQKKAEANTGEDEELVSLFDDDEARPVPPDQLMERMYAREEEEPVLVEDMRDRFYAEEEEEPLPLRDLRQRLFARDEEMNFDEPVEPPEITDGYLHELFTRTEPEKPEKIETPPVVDESPAEESLAGKDPLASMGTGGDELIREDLLSAMAGEFPTAEKPASVTKEEPVERKKAAPSSGSAWENEYMSWVLPETTGSESAKKKTPEKVKNTDTVVVEETKPETASVREEKEEKEADTASLETPKDKKSGKDTGELPELEAPKASSPPKAAPVPATESNLSADDWLDLMAGRAIPDKEEKSSTAVETPEGETDDNAEKDVSGPHLKKQIDFHEHHYVPQRQEPRKEKEEKEPARDGLKKRESFDQTKLKYKKSFTAGAKNPARICTSCAGREKTDKCCSCGTDNARVMARLCDKCANNKKTAMNCVSCGRPNSRRIAKLCDRCGPKYRRACYKCGAKL